MTAVIHSSPSPMVTSDSTTTPAATSRADTSLTGLGKEKSDRIRLGRRTVSWVVMTCIGLPSGPNPLTLTSLVGIYTDTPGRPGKTGLAAAAAGLSRAAAPAAEAAAPRSGRRGG